MSEFSWRTDLIEALEPLAPLLLIEGDEDARVARAALEHLPMPHNPEQAIVLRILKQLIEQALERWQAAQDAVRHSEPIVEPEDHALQFLNVLMRQHQLKAVDLRELIGSKPLLSLIFSGKRRLTRDHITRLSRHFRVSPALFFPPLPAAPRGQVREPDPKLDPKLSDAGLWLELRMYIETHLPESQTKTRNMDLVCDYFGFSVSPWEDLQTLAVKYRFGSRERSRQIVEMAFREYADAADLPIARQVASLLEIAGAISMEDFTHLLSSHGLLDQKVQARGLLIYLRELGLCPDFKVFTKDMTPLGKSLAVDDPPLWLIDTNRLNAQKNMLQALLVLPGQIGLACLDDFFAEHELDDWQQKLVCLMLDNRSDTWRVLHEEKTWFAIEGRSNRIVHDLGKIFSVLDQCTPARLAHCIHNGLSNRSQKQRRPPVELIEKYIRSSLHTKFDGTNIRFTGQTVDLTPVEQDTLVFLKKRDYANYPELKAHLLKRGHNKPNIDKATTKSSLVFVDKSRGRSHYRYSWVGA